QGWRFECNLGALEDNLSYVQEACKGKNYLLEPIAYDALGEPTKGFALYLRADISRVPEEAIVIAEAYLKVRSFQQEGPLLKMVYEQLQKREGEFYGPLSSYESSSGTWLRYFADKMRSKDMHEEAEVVEERVKEFMVPLSFMALSSDTTLSPTPSIF
ncbi:MAG: hypothetical protein Q7K45_00985, partial [Nanoarchaeota archaeon]|nr:hypothetical protein [Nanoarchaeota archaeon]